MVQDFADLSEFTRVLQTLPAPDDTVIAAAIVRNTQLTKPPGALGRLEELAIWYCGWRQDVRARVERPQVVIFAGNHGVAALGVSAFPSDVTTQMVANFNAGGAAINQLSKSVGASLDVHAVQLDRPTADFTKGPAMTKAELIEALQLGWGAVDPHADALVVGEMGIGNTTSAAAVCTALFGGQADNWTGRGTGIADDVLHNKADVVSRGVSANRDAAGQGIEVLRCLGGRELGAMAGAIVRARSLRIPVVLDGFISCAAAACLQAEHPDALGHCVAGHVSAEGAHASLLKELGKTPLLSLDMRLGEGSGGALAISILRAALACHSDMATFAEAGVSKG